MNPITTERLAEIRKLAEKATPGERYLEGDGEAAELHLRAKAKRGPIAIFQFDSPDETDPATIEQDANATLAAALDPDTVLALVAGYQREVTEGFQRVPCREGRTAWPGYINDMADAFDQAQAAAFQSGKGFYESFYAGWNAALRTAALAKKE